MLLSLCKTLNPSLVWLDEHGIGFYPVHGAPYDAAYFEKYKGYANTDLGRELIAQRVALVQAWVGDVSVLDVGIGCGAFVEAHPRALGYDVNPVGVAWLQERQLFRDPYAKPVANACFWDSLEHIENPGVLLNNVTDTVFVSIPIFSDIDHVRRSKHFRRDEHYWYFTAGGFIQFMRTLGWHCVERSWMETDLGREDIETYVFRR